MWDKVKMGYVCDRCRAPIWMDVRQERFVQMDIARNKEVDLLLSSRRRKSGDPYVSVSRNAFFDGMDSTTIERNYQFCFDCAPVVLQVMEALLRPRSDAEREADLKVARKEAHEKYMEELDKGPT